MNQLLGRIFAQRRNSGGTDLEAIESALRVALHRAGASALSELLQFEGTALPTSGDCGGLGADEPSVVSV